MKRPSTFALLILGLLIVALACTSTRAPGTPPITPANTFKTFTPMPTVTPFRSPTPTIGPSDTATETTTPSDSETPTQTPRPSRTPLPTSTPRTSLWRP